MLKKDLKLKTQKLRKKGRTLNEIVKLLAVSKSTVSYWCKGIKLSEELKNNIEKNHILKTRAGRLLGAEMNKNKKLEALRVSSQFGKDFIKNINKRELGIVATALYWSEGAKADRTSGFQFVNSDPQMILIIKKFLNEILGVSNDDLVCSIQINEVHKDRIKKVLSFWKNLLHLRDSQIRNPYFVRTKALKVYENHNKYYGICRLMVRRSTILKYKMIGLIEALKADILSG